MDKTLKRDKTPALQFWLLAAAVLGLKAWAPDRKETARLACPLAALAAASLAGVLCVFIQSY